MNIIFKSEREKCAISLGITFLLWGALSMVLIMLLSMRTGGVIGLDFYSYGEIWFEFPFAVGISIFGFWLMWFVARKSRVRRTTHKVSFLSETVVCQHCGVETGIEVRKYDEVRNDTSPSPDATMLIGPHNPDDYFCVYCQRFHEVVAHTDSWGCPLSNRQPIVAKSAGPEPGLRERRRT